MESKPFFYNVLKSKEGDIFTGTSKGIYKITNQSLAKIDGREGYIGLDKKGNLIIEKEGIKNYVGRSFLHLLPYPDQIREAYYAGTESEFFIVSNGVLYSYEITPYNESYSNASVRTISPNFIGTYSGVYFRDNKLPYPTFSDGYIREYNGKAFICCHNLIIRDIPENDQEIDGTKEVTLSLHSQVEDVFYSSMDQRYYVATLDHFARLSPDLTSYEILYTEKDAGISFLGELKGALILAVNNKLIQYAISSNTFDTLYQHNEHIQGGFIDVRKYYFLSENGLHVLNSDGTHQKLADLKSAHTLLPISNTENIISTNAGLHYFNATSNQLSELIPGVEFNKKALFLEGNTIYAGSIKGLFTFSTHAIPELIKRNQAVTITSISVTKKEIVAYCLLALLVLGLLFREVMKGRKKIHSYEEQLEQALASQEEMTYGPKVTRREIEEYIKHRLAEASVQSITNYFNITTSQVYTILKPDKPGTIIQQLRKDKVLEMKKSRVSTKDIALSTGLSSAYIRRLNESGKT